LIEKCLVDAFVKKNYGISIYGSMACGEASEEVLGDEIID
jgi:hypothetical protein